MVVPTPTYTPPEGAKLFSVGKGNNYYTYTQNGTTTITTTGGLVLATSTDSGKSYTYTSDGNKDANLKTALGNPQSTASKTAISTTGSVTPNTATGANAADQQAAQTGQQALNNLSIGTRTGTRKITDYPDNNLLRYPLTMDKKQDYIGFTMLEYYPRKLSTTGLSALDVQQSRPADRTLGSTVVLPIQPTISDANVVKWGSEDMSALEGLAASVAMQAMLDKSDFTQTAKSIQEIAKGVAGGSDSIKAALAAYFAGQASNVKGLLTRVTGGIINPNTELLFQGPDLRTFNFTFSLSAREPAEAQVIRNIIRFFKQGMSVKRADVGLFLKSPHTFQIKYHYNGGSGDHPWLNKIKECALVSFNVNYTPAGNYATFEDGAMTQYDLNLVFTELEPLYDDQDYGTGGGKGNEAEIGY